MYEMLKVSVTDCCMGIPEPSQPPEQLRSSNKIQSSLKNVCVCVCVLCTEPFYASAYILSYAQTGLEIFYSEVRINKYKAGLKLSLTRPK